MRYLDARYYSLVTISTYIYLLSSYIISRHPSSDGRSLTRSLPLGKNKTQTFSLVTSRISLPTCSPDSITWIKTSNPEAATHTPLAKAAKENNPKEKAAVEDAVKVKERAKTKAKAVPLQATTISSNHSSGLAYMNARHRQWSTSIPPQTAMTQWTPTLDHNLRIDHNNLPQIVRSFAYTAPMPPTIRKPATPTPTRSYTTIAPTTGSTFPIMEVNVASCQTMRNTHINKNKHAFLPTVHRAATTQSNLSVTPRSLKRGGNTNDVRRHLRGCTGRLTSLAPSLACIIRPTSLLHHLRGCHLYNSTHRTLFIAYSPSSLPT